LARVPGIQVIVKLHPDEADGSIERELADEAGLTRCSVVEGGDIVDYLLASDLVIVFFSTVGHEAILMGKPLIQIPVGSGEGTIIPFTEEGGALDGSDLSRLGELVRGALADEQVRSELERGREAYIGRHVHAIDGHAADRVAELIVRATEHGRK
jgi:CDP-glycerol glycerophosphotransferase (TagB/SpsB family)